MAQVGALAEAGFFGRKVAASGGKVGVGILCIRGAGGGRPGSMQEEAGRRRLAAEECLSSHRFREDVSLEVPSSGCRVNGVSFNQKSGGACGRPHNNTIRCWKGVGDHTRKSIPHQPTD